jgi:hypothetical protein
METDFDTIEATILEEVELNETVGDRVAPAAELVVDAVGVFEGEARFDDDSEGYSEFDAVLDDEAPRVTAAVGVPDGVLVDDRVGVTDGVIVCDAVIEAVLDIDNPRDTAAVDVAERVGVPVGDIVAVGVCVVDKDGVNVVVGDTLRDAPIERVIVDDLDAVFEGVPEEVSEPVGVLLGVAELVPLEEGVCVCVRVGDNDVVDDNDGDLLGELDALRVVDGVTPALGRAKEGSFVRDAEIVVVRVADGVFVSEAVPELVGVPEPVGVIDDEEEGVFDDV